ncbi:MAG TPA: RdgB/HAM1 family non-canonical purine NTP pyrophosphatase [Pyrinomonadaceae bacterium]|nr:RdgB/HAM1 family non-canonical purine NTP pyrophosphatase [Pyrinomonadaceae bacterium]
MTTQTPSELLIATNNAGKIRELTGLLANLPLRLRQLSEFPQITEVEETGQTFAENASLKARLYSRQTQLWTLADDSGLEVDALDGAPGVLSARYAGRNATDEERCARLLAELSLTHDERRTARFICAIALYDPATATTEIFNGACEGRIAKHPRGRLGFGYDPIFVPSGYAHTFGELSDVVKQQISHRSQALAAVRVYLNGRFSRS